LNRHRITAGSEFQHNFDQFQTNYDVTATYLDSQASTYRWALLIQDEYTITDNLTLNTGVRYDYFSIFGKTVNPRAGLIYQPWSNSTIKFLYGSAFRAPNQYEINYSTPFDFSPSKNLRPEKLETLEFIVEHSFNGHLRSELSLFQTDIKDIVALTRMGNVNQQNKNTGNVESRGVEVQLEDSWDNGFQGRISYSWQETKYANTDERLTNSPEHLIKLNLIIPLWFDKVFLGYETRYVSSRKTASGGEVGDFVINNLTLFTQNWIKGLDLSASAYNLFDARYFDPGSDAHRQNGIQQDGLTCRVKASIDF
jgi:iron complex outermembrane receptor protein